MATGLDSTTALTVIDVLRNIANNRGSTIIVTIHQPSAKIYNLFDKCIFLSSGKVTSKNMLFSSTKRPDWALLSSLTLPRYSWSYVMS
jgi:ABC-type multidrug transport system ATPase subunit